VRSWDEDTRHFHIIGERHARYIGREGRQPCHRNDHGTAAFGTERHFEQRGRRIDVRCNERRIVSHTCTRSQTDRHLSCPTGQQSRRVPQQ
jgi:hypothetical protein